MDSVSLVHSKQSMNAAQSLVFFKWTFYISQNLNLFFQTNICCYGVHILVSSPSLQEGEVIEIH